MGLRWMLKGLACATMWIDACVPAFTVRWVEPRGRSNELFQFGSQSLSLVLGKPGLHLRREFSRIVLGIEASDFVIELRPIFARRGSPLGRGVNLGSFGTIGRAALGDDTLRGSKVDIIGGRHVHRFDRVYVPIRHQGGQFEIVQIGRDTWIGNSAATLAGVGDGAVIGRRSLVVKPRTPYGVFVGKPVRLVRERGCIAGSDMPAATGGVADRIRTGG